MKSSLITAIALAASSEALVRRDWTCCFGLTVNGGNPGGVVGQLADGQNRVGDTSLPAGKYCITNGGITDGQGRGCILTPPTSQYQCDAGAAPTGGFGIGCDGTVAQNGNTAFWICPTGDKGGYNIYQTPPAGQGGCEKVTLNADSCHTGCAPPPPPPPPPPPKTCPTTLTWGKFEFPHLIIPVDSSQPNLAPGTSYFGVVTPTVSSIFNFDIPWSDSGATCSLVFDFPLQSQLETSSFTFSGSGQVDFSLLAAPATGATTFANQPAVAKDLGVTTVAPGNSYVISTFACPAGQRIGYELKSVGGTNLNYFQDYNPSPIGLYITTC